MLCRKLRILHLAQCGLGKLEPPVILQSNLVITRNSTGKNKYVPTQEQCHVSIQSCFHAKLLFFSYIHIALVITIYFTTKNQP